MYESNSFLSFSFRREEEPCLTCAVNNALFGREISKVSNTLFLEDKPGQFENVKFRHNV